MSLAAGETGTVRVFTTMNRGFTPEEIAQRAIDRIISVGDQSHPLLLEQARAFKAQIHAVLIQYLREAQESERQTICGKLNEQGLGELADLIRRL